MREASRALNEGQEVAEGLGEVTGMHSAYSFVKEKSVWVGPNLSQSIPSPPSFRTTNTTYDRSRLSTRSVRTNTARRSSDDRSGVRRGLSASNGGGGIGYFA